MSDQCSSQKCLGDNVHLMEGKYRCNFHCMSPICGHCVSPLCGAQKCVNSDFCEMDCRGTNKRVIRVINGVMQFTGSIFDDNCKHHCLNYNCNNKITENHPRICLGCCNSTDCDHCIAPKCSADKHDDSKYCVRHCDQKDCGHCSKSDCEARDTHGQHVFCEKCCELQEEECKHCVYLECDNDSHSTSSLCVAHCQSFHCVHCHLKLCDKEVYQKDACQDHHY